jgi:plastocyanin
MKVFLIVLLTACQLAAMHAGTITGTVRAEGKAGADADALCGKYDSRQFKFLERINYAELRDFIVFIDGPVAGQTNAPDKPMQVTTERVTQQGAIFLPHVLPIMAGTTVEWPNNDEILHNVFSLSDTTNFNLGLYRSPTVGKVTFNKPGRADVFCSIHSRMSCIVLVLENPFFAAANEKGRYAIPNVPPGKYQLKAWHERMPSQSMDITVPVSGDVKMDFTLGFKSVATR